MTELDNLFSEAIELAFAEFDRHRIYERSVRAGPFSLRLLIRSHDLSIQYPRSFLSHKKGLPNAHLGIIKRSELDLSHLLPEPRSKGRVFSNGRFFVVWHPDRWSVLYALDRWTGRGVVWLADDVATEWELSRPACPIFHALSLGTSWIAVHGSGVGLDDDFLLLVGKGRAGKTTAALACVRAGWDYAGDDYVLFDTEFARIEPMYTSARLRADLGHCFSELLRAGYTASDEAGEPRYELRLADYLPPMKMKGGSLSAILIPRRQGSDRPIFEPANRADAFQALFMTTRLGMPAPVTETARKLGLLIGKAAVFFVDTGKAPQAIPDAFGEFLRQRRIIDATSPGGPAPGQAKLRVT